MRLSSSVPVDRLLAATEAAADFAAEDPKYFPLFDRLANEMTNRAPTRDEVERAHKVAARLCALHGEEFLPYFEAMERNLAELDRKDELMAKARRIARDSR